MTLISILEKGKDLVKIIESSKNVIIDTMSLDKKTFSKIDI